MAIHFFPGGYAEQAFVWLGEEAEPDEEAEASVTLSPDSRWGVTRQVKEAFSPA